MFSFCRRGHDDLGDHYLLCGDLHNALKCYSRARDYCTNAKHVISMCINVIKVSSTHWHCYHLPPPQLSAVLQYWCQWHVTHAVTCDPCSDMWPMQWQLLEYVLLALLLPCIIRTCYSKFSLVLRLFPSNFPVPVRFSWLLGLGASLLEFNTHLLIFCLLQVNEKYSWSCYILK